MSSWHTFIITLWPMTICGSYLHSRPVKIHDSPLYSCINLLKLLSYYFNHERKKKLYTVQNPDYSTATLLLHNSSPNRCEPNRFLPHSFFLLLSLWRGEGGAKVWESVKPVLFLLVWTQNACVTQHNSTQTEHGSLFSKWKVVWYRFVLLVELKLCCCAHSVGNCIFMKVLTKTLLTHFFQPFQVQVCWSELSWYLHCTQFWC